MTKQAIETAKAPSAIGTYSQAVRAGSTVYLSGQIGLEPESMQMAEGIEAQTRRVFDNLRAVAEAAGGSLDGMVKLTVYLTDLAHFPRINEIMAEYFRKPYPARAAVGVAALPRGAMVEIEGVMALP
ncbi:MAG: Enamine/imine deaminase [Syntrophaceae bacterium PtaB.Bin095]|jgi:reactive intermediate/imine deaminase|nr:MAG: Enamine/imine deaminase [Syntrophaceae bacterium PtaB.Bin095]